ncbi:MAG: HEAT repeat domain-containing protein, partial [Myxococcota bacterium]
KGVTKKKKGGGFNGKFGSTIMGTALFMVEMQKKVPLKTKLAVLFFLLLAGGFGGYVWREWSLETEARETLASVLAMEPSEQGSRLRQLLGDGHLDETGRVQAREQLVALGDADVAPFLIEGLSGSDDELIGAATALVRVGLPGAAEALPVMNARLGEVETEQEQLVLAWALVALGDSAPLERVLDGLQSGALQSIDGFEENLLADRMGRDALQEALGDSREVVRQLGAEHLGFLCDASVVPGLIEATSDASEPVVLAAMVSLGKCGTPEALAAAASALERTAAQRTSAQVAFEYKVGAPGLGLLFPYATTDEAKGALLSAMSTSADPRLGDVILQELVRSPEPNTQTRLQMVRAMAEVGDARALEVAEPLLAHEDEQWRIAAIQGLAFGPPNADTTARFLELLRDRALRSIVVKSLGEQRACDEEVRSAMNRIGGPDALRAAGRCGESGERALSLIQRGGAQGRVTASDGAIRLAAYDVLARAPVPEATEPMYERLVDSSYDARLRNAAAHTLGIVADDTTRQRLMDKALEVGGNDSIRSAARTVLRHGAPDAGADRLIGYLRSGGDDERTRFAVELVALWSPATFDRELRELLDDERAQTNAAVALSYRGTPESAEALATLFRSNTELAAEVSRRARAITFP